MDILIIKMFLPEIFFSLSVLFQLFYNTKIITNYFYNHPIIIKEISSQTIVIIISTIFLLYNLKIEGFFSNFLFSVDENTKILKLILLIVSFFITKIINQSFRIQKLNFFEFFIFFLFSLFSLLLLISADDLISVYLVIEMQALCFYVMASFKRNSAFSSEAGLKYFIIGSLISGVFLFGISLIYGTLGTLNFTNLNLLLAFKIGDENSSLRLLIHFGVLIIIFTFLFKLACAPFHFWAPDVYEGAPLSSTIIFSILPKIAIFSFLIKFLSSLGFIFLDIQNFLLFVGTSSMLVGTLFALNQKRVKRLMIYSSIAQIGLIIISLSLNSLNGFAASYFYLINYLISSTAIWGIIVQAYSSNFYINSFYLKDMTVFFLTSLSKIFDTNKLFAFLTAILFFSIAGIPPLLGFLAKVLVLIELARTSLFTSLIILLTISAISVFYYIRIIKILFFEPISEKQKIKYFQITFFNNNLDGINVIITFSIYLLVIFFFYFSIIDLLTQYCALTSFYY